MQSFLSIKTLIKMNIVLVVLTAPSATEVVVVQEVEQLIYYCTVYIVQNHNNNSKHFIFESKIKHKVPNIYCV